MRSVLAMTIPTLIPMAMVLLVLLHLFKASNIAPAALPFLIFLVVLFGILFLILVGLGICLLESTNESSISGMVAQRSKALSCGYYLIYWPMDATLCFAVLLPLAGVKLWIFFGFLSSACAYRKNCRSPGGEGGGSSQ